MGVKSRGTVEQMNGWTVGGVDAIGWTDRGMDSEGME